MIPQFPSSKKLELTDKDEIENFTRNFPPYSDYNFVSLYSYDTQNTIELSYLNDNLVILFEDYISAEPVYSFLGANNFIDTSEQLLNMAEKMNIVRQLKLVPEGNFGGGPKEISGFQVIEDPDNFDYILSVEKLSNLAGGEFQDKRNLYNRFHLENPDAEIRVLNLSDDNVQKEIIQLFNIWVERKQKSKEETQHEETAIRRLLDASSYFNLVAIGIYKQNKLISFAIAEIVNNNFSVFHFVKADTQYKGNFETIYNALAKELLKAGSLYVNYEQHLGIENLKKSKELWRPVDYLKKYIISPLA